MWYAIVTEDTPHSLEKRLANRPAHLARLTALQELGRLLLAGPFPAIDSIDPGPAGFTGSLIVAEFNRLAEAEIWANEEPFVNAGIFDSVSVKHFPKTFPA